MKIYVVDFEQVLKNFINYHESLKLIQIEKDKFSDDIESIKKEMEGIISASRLLVDDKSQMEQATKFKELQAKAIKLESEFRSDIVELQNSELEKNFSEVSEIVKEWATKDEIDMVINKNQSLFVSDKFDATESIIEVLKNKQLYKEYNERYYAAELLSESK
jgi:Skp family chaperone for outer membrane proteins